MHSTYIHIWHSLSHGAIFTFFLEETPNRFDEWTTSGSTSWDTTEKKTNIAPEHRPKPKLKVVFQLYIFPGALTVSFSKSNTKNMLTYPSFITEHSIAFSHGFRPTGLPRFFRGQIFKIFCGVPEPGSRAKVQTIRQRSRSRVARVETTTWWKRHSKRQKVVTVEHVNVFFLGGNMCRKNLAREYDHEWTTYSIYIYVIYIYVCQRTQMTLVFLEKGLGGLKLQK